MPNIYTTGEIAQLCEVAPRTVMRWIDNGLLKGFRVPGSLHRRVLRADLIQFLQVNGMPLEKLAAGKTYNTANFT